MNDANILKNSSVIISIYSVTGGITFVAAVTDGIIIYIYIYIFFFLLRKVVTPKGSLNSSKCAKQSQG